jgi:rSAM/selenodomain-associated transferase 1
MFARFPQKGKVKSRLAAAIGEERTLELYKCFVADLLQTIGKSGYPLVLSFYPPDAGREMKEWLGDGHSYLPQQGDDIGERMRNAFETVFSRGYRSALLIGSDLPDLTAEILDEAFSSLQEHDAVIGPALDGGYYLIGFTKETFVPEVFSDISWSTAEVFQQTMNAFFATGRTTHVLPPWRDMDTIDDVRATFSPEATQSLSESATMRYLRERKGEII